MTDEIASLLFLICVIVGCLQLTFVFLVLPCLLLGYLGQAAYLISNPSGEEQPFFYSIPSKFIINGYWISK